MGVWSWHFMSTMFGGKFLIVLATGLNIVISIVAEGPVCYSREQVDDLNVKVTRVPCDEEESTIFQRFGSREDVTITDLLDVKCRYEKLPRVLNGSFKIKDCTGRYIGDNCRLTCDDGFTLVSSSAETTCQDKGNNRAAWSLDEFSCRRFSCPFGELPKVSHGFINKSDCSGDTGHDVCSVTCEDDHYPVNSQETICEYVGSQHGRWRPANLSCSPIFCSFNDLPSVLNGRFSNCSGNLVGDTCNMTCHVNYYTTTMKKTVCQNIGYHQGRWTDDNFTCDAVSCPLSDLPSVMNGQFDINDCSGNLVDDTCNMTCYVNYYATTMKTTLCKNVGNHTGEWTEDNFICEAITCLFRNLPGVALSQFYQSGSSGNSVRLSDAYHGYELPCKLDLCKQSHNL